MCDQKDSLLYTVAPAEQRGPVLRVYGAEIPAEEWEKRLCCWLKQRKEICHDSNDELGGGHPRGG